MYKWLAIHVRKPPEDMTKVALSWTQEKEKDQKQHGDAPSKMK
jgi:hypothetical protein